MNPGDAMLKDILACPKDDVVRLVYADWLDMELGQTARADFIRIQVALAPVRVNCCCFSCVWRRGSGAIRGGLCEADQPPYARLYEREQELFQECALKWFGSELGLSLEGGARYLSLLLSSAVYDRPGDYEILLGVDRGFVHRVEAIQDSWLRYGTSLVSQPIQEVRLQDKRPWRSVNDFWVWNRDFDDRETFGANIVLADGLFLFLPESDPGARRDAWPRRRWYKSEARAWEALSLACIGWARNQLIINEQPKNA